MPLKERLVQLFSKLEQKRSDERNAFLREENFDRFCAEHTICPGSDLAKSLRTLTAKYVSQNNAAGQKEAVFQTFPTLVLSHVAESGIINGEWLQKVRKEAKHNAFLEAASKVHQGGWPERSLTGINMAEVLWDTERTQKILGWLDANSEKLLQI